MSNNILASDIQIAKDVAQGKNNELFSRIFYCSNEDVSRLLSRVDFKDKKVLSVCGSGDFYFHCINNGATDIDLYDINSLSIYYVYFRKWIMEKFGVYYPKFEMFLLMNKNKLKEFLCNIQCHSSFEIRALEFWRILLDLNIDLVNLFIRPLIMSQNNIFNLKQLIDYMNKETPNFYGCDIAGEEINIDKKYDIIITSNILEHFGLNESRMVLCRDNLYSLLNPNGKVICSLLLTADFDYPRESEKNLFSEHFDYSIFTEKVDDYNFSYAYVYTKKDGVNKK